ncbi:zinc finger protein 518A-like [Hyla sarda]|uniref:zinc finger protein 518A-like n=1 Tax=Hyla sarda TaxID=327740 RepID=UPI0024C3DD5B|nr:zinc finger protein 518A-like [Hyla sarda]XP_056385769.1 zinc finger protein 518A-like [Hyla sarda]
MRSPNKDFFKDIEGSASSKDAIWDFSGNTFASGESNTLSSLFSADERIMQGIEEHSDASLNLTRGNVALSDMAEMASKSLCKKQTARKSLAKGNLNDPGNPEEENADIKIEPNLDDDSGNISAKVLHFFCQKCKNGIRYSPNDLQKHFLICHNGELPLYPCEMCNFTANDFQAFKQHRKTHRSALVKCEICNNDYLYTLLGLTKHFTVMHCVNGHFNCSKCRFSTRDVGTFVQHIHRHNGIEYACQKCNHISYSKIEFQRHLQGHSTMLPFSCQYCSYSAMRKDFIVKHILTRHREHIHTRDDLVPDNSKPQMVQTNAGLKLVLKKYQSESQDNSPWRHDGKNPVLEKGGDSNDNASGFQHKFADNQPTKDFPRFNTESEQTVNDGIPSVTTIKCNKDDASAQGNMGLLQNAVHGPTVLMVKNNKITVPANYTATFVGYKMVNGKQNLVIKLLPTNKQAANTTQPSPQSSNSLPRFSQGSMQGSYAASNTKDNRATPSYKPPSITTSTPTTPADKQPGSLRNLTTALGSLMARKNESMSKLAAPTNRQHFHEPIHKNLNSMNKSNPSTSNFVQKIKEEPAEYNINEKQFFDTDHTYESPSDRMNSSIGSSRLSIDPTTGFLVRPQQNNEVSGPRPKQFYGGKNFNSPMMRAATTSGLGNFTGTSPSYIRNAQINERMPRSAEMNKPENISFMPRITSVFSLQNRPSDPKPVAKNTYLHNMLQDNKRLNDKGGMVNSQSPHPGNKAFVFPKQPLSSPVQQMSSPITKFDNRIQNGNTPSAVFLKQEPVSPGSSIKSSQPSRVSELLKTHSDAIVSQQLAKDKMNCMVKPSSGPTPLQLYHNPQLSGMSQANPVLYPSGSNRFVLPIVPTNQSGLKIISSQTNAPSTAAFSTGNRFNTPVMVNTKPGMVLTIANGPFGTIRNVTNGSPQMIGTVNNIGKMALPRLQRPPVPHGFKPNVSASPNSVPANIVSGSAVGSKLPLNLNVLQYCINSDGSRTQVGTLEANKQPETLQKQPVYALLPDGKQAVLLNYVLPKTVSANTQNPVQLNRVQQKLLPKKPDDVQQPAFLRSSSEASATPSASIKEEDISSLDGYGGNVPTDKVSDSDTLQSKPAEKKPFLRSTSSGAQAEEHSSNDDNSVSQASSSSSRLAKLRCKQGNLIPSNSKNKTCKRKASDAGSYEADVEFKTKKRVVDVLVDVPRKQMLHRKCKAKSYASEVDMESLPEDQTPTPSKEIVRTLRLYPFSPNQSIKYPRRDQPVVVLNHPDADVPEVVNLMRTISKFNGHVLKVSLSKRTLEALLESKLLNSAYGLSRRHHRRAKPVSPVKERFVLKLTLKKTSKNNYKIVKNTPANKLQTRFNCWFCGRIFDNQDEWVGHGQRHLMEATKDWNTLF